MFSLLTRPSCAGYCILQVQREQRRVAKWRHMLGSSSSDFEAYCRERMKKVKRRVRKGIPDEFRGYAWQLLSGERRAAVACALLGWAAGVLTVTVPIIGVMWHLLIKPTQQPCATGGRP